MTKSQVYESVQSHCLSKPDVAEDYPWDDVAWKVKGKMFCCTSKDSNHITVKSTLDKQQALIQHPHISVAAYLGRYGWVSVEIDNEDDLETALDLVDESYDLITKKKR